MSSQLPCNVDNVPRSDAVGDGDQRTALSDSTEEYLEHQPEEEAIRHDHLGTDYANNLIVTHASSQTRLSNINGLNSQHPLSYSNQKISLKNGFGDNTCNKECDSFTTEQEREIKYHIDINQQLRDEYKNTLEDITGRYEIEIHRLRNEIAALRAENELLKIQSKFTLN